MKGLANSLAVLALGLLVLAMLAPTLIALSQALLPLVIAIGAVTVVVRLVYHHTRRW